MSKQKMIDTTPSGKATRELKAMIRDGRIVSGERMPSEHKLATVLKVSRTSVRSAIAQLERQGLIRPMKGRGRMVVGSPSVLAETVVLLSNYTGRGFLVGRPAEGWPDFVVTAATWAVRQHGLHALVAQVGRFDEDRMQRLISDPPRGVICFYDVFYREEGRRLLQELKAARIPVVVQGEGLVAPQHDTVYSDHESGAYDLTVSLHERGCRRILRYWHVVAGEESRPAWLAMRDAGYERACKDLGIKPLPAVEISYPHIEPQTPEEFQAPVRMAAGVLVEHFAGRKGADAVMVATDGEVPPVIAACKLLGRTPGKDVFVAGYDNYWFEAPERRWEPTPPSVTIDRQNSRIGAELAGLLADRMDGKLEKEVVVRAIKPKLVIPGA